MFARTRLATLVMLSACLAGCPLEHDAKKGSSSAEDAIRLAPAGSEAALAAYLEAGSTKLSSGELDTQQMVGAPTRFAGVEVMADGSGMAPAAGGSTGGTGTTGGTGAMAGNAPADDGLNNVQVTGVEEPDLVKSDGTYLYVAEQPDAWIYPVPVALPPEDEFIGRFRVDPILGDAAARGLLWTDKVTATDATDTFPIHRMTDDVVLVLNESVDKVALGASPAPVPRDGITVSVDGSVDPGSITVPRTDARIARYRLDAATPTATALPSLPLPGDASYMSHLQLLLSGGDSPFLVAMGQSGGYWAWDAWFAAMPYSVSQETQLWIYDVSDPENVPAALKVTLKGQMIDSRRIGDKVYLVTRYTPRPDIDPLVPKISTDMPEVPLYADTEEDMVPPADCLIPSEGSDGYPSLTFITAIDLADPAAAKSACFSGEVYTMYMTQTSLYLAAQKYNADFNWGIGTEPVPVAVREDGSVLVEDDAGDVVPTSEPEVPAIAPVDTVIHRFALGDGNPHYTGSGRVAGGFTGWMGSGSQPQWRFNERNGLLYVITSWWDYDDLHHHLYVLQPDDEGDLIVRAALPNAENPQPIGKPREDIYAVRYVGERAYVVTFQRTDPLYVISLADPLAPVVAGTLELPGFSAYLHPIGADWLLGIGQGGSGGVEANLFDVRDPANPSVHGHVALCAQCNAPLLTDYHAIAVLGVGGVTRVAVPLQDWSLADETNWAPVEQARLLEITQADGVLSDAGTANAGTGYTALGRVLLIADAIFQPLNGAVAVSGWPAS